MLTLWQLEGGDDAFIGAQDGVGQARPCCAAMTIHPQISAACNNKGLFLVPTRYSLQVSQGSVPHWHDSHLKFISDGAVCTKEKREGSEAPTGS